LKIKEIPVKILVPLLEHSSLEEDDELQDKWAKMLANMVDSELNLQNHIFPYLLSQISLAEFNALRKLSTDEAEYLDALRKLSEKLKDDVLLRNRDLREEKERIEHIEQRGLWIDLEGYERANLVRLGVIRELPPKIFIPEFSTGGQLGEGWHKLEAEYDHDDFGYRITELGERFLEICELKDRKS